MAQYLFNINEIINFIVEYCLYLSLIDKLIVFIADLASIAI